MSRRSCEPERALSAGGQPSACPGTSICDHRARSVSVGTRHACASAVPIEKRIVYVLRSDSDSSHTYVGLTSDLKQRLRLHNTSGLYRLSQYRIPERGARMARRDDRECCLHLRKEQRRQAGCPARKAVVTQPIQATSPTGHTVRYRPWCVVVSIDFSTESAARRFERYLKSGSGRAFAKRHFGMRAEPIRRSRRKKSNVAPRQPGPNRLSAHGASTSAFQPWLANAANALKKTSSG